MGAFVESEERLAALVESETNSASAHVRLTELLALEARRNVVAEARLQVVKDRARAEVTMAHAELAIAMQRLGSQDHELQIALGRLADFSSSMSHELCAIALAQSAGKLSAFATTRTQCVCARMVLSSRRCEDTLQVRSQHLCSHLPALASRVPQTRSSGCCIRQPSLTWWIARSFGPSLARLPR